MSSKIEITINNTSNDFQTFSVRQSAIGGDTNPLTCSDQMYPYIGVPLTITDFSVAPNPGSPKISVYTITASIPNTNISGNENENSWACWCEYVFPAKSSYLLTIELTYSGGQNSWFLEIYPSESNGSPINSSNGIPMQVPLPVSPQSPVHLLNPPINYNLENSGENAYILTICSDGQSYLPEYDTNGPTGYSTCCVSCGQVCCANGTTCNYGSCHY